MKTVNEVSKITGVSVRALHYYDSIGLLRPAKVNASGYRLYDDESLKRLSSIMMFKELGFALSDIGRILDSTDFSLEEALEEHVRMLKLQREHIDGLIFEAERMMKGEDADFRAFDRSEMEKYAEEVKARWGDTDAYRQSQEKLKGKSEGEMKGMADGLTDIFRRLGGIKESGPDSDEAQSLVRELQEYITGTMYECTDEILSGLGMMYAADERFRRNIDRAGGEGTSAFAAEAIKIYCGR